jgi:hypothetical protein
MCVCIYIHIYIYIYISRILWTCCMAHRGVYSFMRMRIFISSTYLCTYACASSGHRSFADTFGGVRERIHAFSGVCERIHAFSGVRERIHAFSGVRERIYDCQAQQTTNRCRNYTTTRNICVRMTCSHLGQLFKIQNT